MTLLSAFGGGLWFILLVLFGGAGYSWFRYIKKGYFPALYAAIILSIAAVGAFFWMWAER